MSLLLLTDRREIEISEDLARRLEAAAIAHVSAAARIADDELSPALLLIADGELVLVTRRGTQRWMPSELRRVEATDIVPVSGDPVTFASWSATGERADFLRAVARLVAAAPAAPPAGAPPEPGPAIAERSEDDPAPEEAAAAHDIPRWSRPASENLHAAAVFASVIDVVLALNIVGYMILRGIGSEYQFGLPAWEILIFIPYAAPFVLAAALAPPIFAIWKLETRGAAWLLIALVPIGCLITAAQLGSHVLEVNGSRDRDRAAVRAFAGAHGEGLGFRFVVRPAAGDRMLELVVTPLAGSAFTESPTELTDVFCEIRRGQVQFADGPGVVKETASGAVFTFREFSSHGDPKPSDQFSGSYCSFKDSSGAWFHASMHG